MSGVNIALSSDPVSGQLSVTVSPTTAITISYSCNVPSGSVVDSYGVMWKRNTSGECPDEDEGSATITDGSTSYTITGLEENSRYTIPMQLGMQSVSLSLELHQCSKEGFHALHSQSHDTLTKEFCCLVPPPPHHAVSLYPLTYH